MHIALRKIVWACSAAVFPDFILEDGKPMAAQTINRASIAQADRDAVHWVEDLTHLKAVRSNESATASFAAAECGKRQKAPSSPEHHQHTYAAQAGLGLH